MKTTVDDHLPVTINRGELGKILDCLCRAWDNNHDEEISNTVLWIRRRLAGLDLEEEKMRDWPITFKGNGPLGVLFKSYQKYIKMADKIQKKEKFEVNGYLFDSEEAAREHIAEKEKIESVNSFNFSLVSCYPYNYIPVEWGQGVNIVAKAKSWDDEIICLLSGEKLRYVREEIKLLMPQEFMKKFQDDSFTIHAANFSDTIRALRDINQRAGGDWRELVDLIAELEIHPEYYDLGD